jgi:hypothetical protein
MDKDHIIKTSFTYEVTMAIGGREGYHGRRFTKDEVLDAISEYQNISSVAMPVKVTSNVTFINKDYRERGFDISAICYPNSPSHPDQVEEFMFSLAEHLLYRLNQNRITIRKLWADHDFSPSGDSHSSTIMLERKNAEKTHKK